MMHWQTHQQSWISSAEWAISVLSSAKSSSLASIFVVFVFALKCATVKRSAFWRDWMYIPSPMYLKASSRIADKNIEKSVGASTHPCLTPFVIENVSETSPPFLTFTIIPVCRLSIMVVNFSGHPYFLSSCHSPVLPTVSNTIIKSTKTEVDPALCTFPGVVVGRRSCLLCFGLNESRTVSLTPPLG